MRGIHRDRWIPRTKGQLRGKCFHLMTSSWYCLTSMIEELHELSPAGKMTYSYWSGSKTNCCCVASSDIKQTTLLEKRVLTHWGRDKMAAISHMFKCIFFNENISISIKISLKIVSNVQMMAWRRSGDKPLFEPMVISLVTHINVTRHQWIKWMLVLTPFGPIFINT